MVSAIKSSHRIVVFLLLVILALIWLFVPWSRSDRAGSHLEYLLGSSKRFPSNETLASRSLKEDQCARTFPGLFQEVERAVAQGSFQLKKRPADYGGCVQGRIKDGKLYVISAVQDNVLSRVGAILHSIHRAILTSPVSLPDTIFALTINDEPRLNSWSFARSDDPISPPNPWLMPHFSSWSWPRQFLGPLDAALDKITLLEKNMKWEEKIDQAVWRGTAWFNPIWDIGLRPKLLDTTKGKEWADVEIWKEGGGNTIPVDGFCRYKYIIYAEGKTYSGRLPYHQGCASVILTPPPTFVLHTTHLMRPLFSSFLPLSPHHPRSIPSQPAIPPPSAYPLFSTNTTWPLSYPPSVANVIFIRPDWSDLEDTINYLRQNPEIGERIARQQREDMFERGYLSEAAEACYWRRLIRGWSEQVRINEVEWEEGTRWETYSLTKVTSS